MRGDQPGARVCHGGGVHCARPSPLHPSITCTCVIQAKEVDYRDLPQPVRYEELQREVMSE